MFGLLYTGAELPVVASDELQARIMSGKIKIVGHLREFKGHEVTTVDGRVLAAVDNVINATGYKRDLSVLDKSLGLGERREGEYIKPLLYHALQMICLTQFF